MEDQAFSSGTFTDVKLLHSIWVTHGRASVNVQGWHSAKLEGGCLIR